MCDSTPSLPWAISPRWTRACVWLLLQLGLVPTLLRVLMTYATETFACTATWALGQVPRTPLSMHTVQALMQRLAALLSSDSEELLALGTLAVQAERGAGGRGCASGWLPGKAGAAAGACL